MNTEPQINGRFKPDDFKDVVGLASKLCAGTTTIDKYLVGRLSAAGVDAVAKAAEPEADLNALKSAFATELNRICDGAVSYTHLTWLLPAFGNICWCFVHIAIRYARICHRLTEMLH